MSKFVLTAQLQLQPPRNTTQVINNLRNQLAGGLNVPVTVTGAAKAQKQVQNVAKSTAQASKAAQDMGRSFGLAFKRFAAFTVASRAVSLFTNTLANAIDEAIDFQREIVKISQVTGTAVKDLQGLERTIFRLSKTLGVNNRELLSTTRILSQAGIRARDLEVALAALAKTTLAPTFEDIEKTAEGAIAILAQFKSGVGALENQLGSINAVAGQFAVESGDLIGAIRRTGGVFKESGGDLEEFLALFTSIRATTRESSESIATGLRTIFTRIQRPRTIEFLRQYGVELTNLDGQFVGTYEAVRRLNQAFAGLEQGDLTFIRVAEELGGFRQIGKVIPLIKEFELAERARQAAIEGGNSLSEDAAKAQQTLAVQINKVKQEFSELIQNISNSTVFQAFVKTSLGLASALIKVADSIRPLLPLLGALATFKIAKSLGGFAAGVGGALRGAAGKNQGGKILAFARGGMVPGQGNRDTVPAMLQPGEFVMRKSSVKKMGASNLAAMNNNRYSKGGKFDDRGSSGGIIGLAGLDPNAQSNVQGLTNKQLFNSTHAGKPGVGKAKKDILKKARGQYYADQNKDNPAGVYGTDYQKIGALILKPGFKKGGTQNETEPSKTGISSTTWYKDGIKDKANKGLLLSGSSWGAFPASKSNLAANKAMQRSIKAGTKIGLKRAVTDTITGMSAKGKLPGTTIDSNSIRKSANAIAKDDKGAVQTTEGYILEGLFSAITGAKLAGEDASFDLPNMTGKNRKRIKSIFGASASKLKKADVKRSYGGATDAKGGIKSKIVQDLEKGVFTGMKKYAKGGSVQDTVPALLTPGEFVINKSSAQAIGYSNLNSMNKSGIAKFNRGGAVGVQKFNQGGMAQTAMFGIAATVFSTVTASLQDLGTEADGTKNAFGRVTDVLTKYTVAIVAAVAIWGKMTGKTLTFQTVIDKLKNPVQNFKAGLEKISEAATVVADNVKAGSQGFESKEGFEKEYFKKGPGGEETQVFDTGKKDKKGKKIFRPKDEQGKFKSGGAGFREEGLDVRQGKSTGFRLRDKTGFTKANQTSFTEKRPKGFIGPMQQKTLGTGAGTVAADSELARKSQMVGKAFSDAQAAVKKLIPAKVLERIESYKLIAAKMKERVMGSKTMEGLTKRFKGFGDNFSKGFKFKGLGKGVQGPAMPKGKGFGGGLGRIAQKIPGGKMVGGLVSKGATAFIGASAAAGGGMAGAAAGVAAIAGPAIAVVGALKLLNDVTGALIDTEGRKKDAIEAGAAAEAGSLAASQNFDNWLTGNFQQALAQGAQYLANGIDSLFGTDNPKIERTDGLIEGTDELGTAGSFVAKGLDILSGDIFSASRKIGQAAAMMAAAMKNVTQNNRDAADALKDFELGNISASKLFDSQSKNFKNFGEANKKQQEALAATGGKENKSGAFGKAGRFIARWGTLGLAGMAGLESGDERNQRIDATVAKSEESKKKFEEEFDSMQPAFTSLGKSITASGGSVEDFEQALKDNGTAAYLSAEQLDTLKTRFEQNAQEMERQIAYIKALNFGLRDATAAANAMGVTMNNIVAAGEAGFNNFTASAAILEASVTSAGKNISDTQMDAALGDLESSLRTFGVDEKKIGETTGTVRGLRDAQGNTGLALEKAQAALLKSGGAGDPAAVKDALKEGLLDNIEGPAAEKLEAAIDNMKIDENVRAEIKAGNLDSVLKQTLDPITKAAAEEAVALVKKRGELENQLINATKKRIQQEQEYLQAQKAAIDTQLEAAGIFEEFGGAKLTGGQKLGARTAQANLSLGAAGVGGLNTGSAKEIRAASEAIKANARNLNDRANAAVLGQATGASADAAFAGAAGLDEDTRPQQKEANKALIEFTKQRVGLLREELAIAQQKNKAEKDALDSLLAGDIEGYLEGQMAASAGAALRSGDSSLAGSFGAGALAAGFQTLDPKTMGDQAYQSAAAMTLGSVGVSDPRAAQVMAGTTAEESAIKSEARELAGVLGDLGSDAAQLENMDVTAANVIIKAANMEIDKFENKNAGAAGFRRGGMVYANRGMFVPRGTDTVPAMLTPGEFVVNAAAVRRGNNLSLLKSMNGGMGAGGMGMSAGGMVYMKEGGFLGKVAKFMANASGGTALKMLGGPDIGKMAEDGVNAVGDAISSNVIDPMKKLITDPTGLAGAFSQFDQSVNKLLDFQLQVKVDPTNVNVNFNGANFLQGLKDDIRNELIEKVKQELTNAKFDETGEIRTNTGM